MGFFVVGAIDLVAVALAGKVFGFGIADVLMLKVPAAGLFVIGGYVFVCVGIYLLFRRDKQKDQTGGD